MGHMSVLCTLNSFLFCFYLFWLGGGGVGVGVVQRWWRIVKHRKRDTRKKIRRGETHHLWVSKNFSVTQILEFGLSDAWS